MSKCLLRIMLALMVCVPVTLSVMGAVLVRAQTLEVSVTATVPSQLPPETPETKVIFKGLAYPSSNVNFYENSTVLAVIPADPSARFDVSFDVAAGTHTYTIYGTDRDGRVGQPYNFTFTISSGTITTVTGIFLGPTIAADKDKVNLGDTVIILGVTAPQSKVNIYVASVSESVYQATADNDGFWARSFIAGQEIASVGGYNSRAKAQAPDLTISEFSKTVSFEVLGGAADACTGAKPGDINCDGKVDLVDFSILLYYWNAENPSNSRADINHDGTANIIDFSIMLYYWTG